MTREEFTKGAVEVVDLALETKDATAIAIVHLANVLWDIREQGQGVSVFRDCLLATLNGRNKA